MNGDKQTTTTVLWRGFLITIVVITVVIVIHGFIIVNRCFDEPATATEGTNDGSTQPPYLAKLRILNGSDKRVRVREVKVNPDPMQASSTNSEDPSWELIQDALEPPVPGWIDPGRSYFASNPGRPEAVYGVWAKVEIEGVGEFQRDAYGLQGLMDTDVTILFEKIGDEYRIVLSVAEGISGASGLAAHKWDEN